MRAAAAALVVLHALCTSTARAESLGGAIAGTFWVESPEALQRHFGCAASRCRGRSISATATPR